jgi:hypothetical protein
LETDWFQLTLAAQKLPKPRAQGALPIYAPNP